ncbi:MAG: hypothetical protein RR806_04965 [Oscillospiraceae bacterium]
MVNSDRFAKELGYIKNDDTKQFAITAINNLPDYFFEVAASSTGKYHPSYALGDGGLVRHTCAAARFANHLLQIEQFQEEFSDRECDLIITAILLHDGWKHGNKASTFTVHEHPQVCADWVKSSEVLDNIIPSKDRAIISEAIASHMGQWNESKKSRVVLEKPNTEIQKFVHMCDYLASRKDLEVLFDEIEAAPVDINDYIMPFGKHKGELLVEIAKNDKSYLVWASQNLKLQRPLDGFIKKLVKESDPLYTNQ